MKRFIDWVTARLKENSTHKGLAVVVGCTGAFYFLFIEKNIQLALGSIIVGQTVAGTLNVLVKEPSGFKTVDITDLSNLPKNDTIS